MGQKLSSENPLPVPVIGLAEIEVFTDILNPEGFLNHTIDSKVLVVLPDMTNMLFCKDINFCLCNTAYFA